MLRIVTYVQGRSEKLVGPGPGHRREAIMTSLQQQILVL